MQTKIQVMLDIDPSAFSEHVRIKTRHCLQDATSKWILDYCGANCEMLPTSHKKGKHGKLVEETVYVVPFMTVTDFHEEYKQDKNYKSSYSTFHRAFHSLSNVRLMRCKGDHAGCPICIHAGELLAGRGAKKLTEIGRYVSSMLVNSSVTIKNY